MRTIDHPVQFLVDNGLLFEINRQVLHPLGLELRLRPRQGDQPGSIEIVDNRDNPQPLVFTPEQYNKGRASYEAYLGAHGRKNIKKRRQMGVKVQTGPVVHPKLDPKEPE